MLKFCLAQKSKTTKHDYVIDMFVIFRPIATRNDDVCTRLYPIRLKKYIAIAHVGKLEFGTILKILKQRLLHLITE